MNDRIRPFELRDSAAVKDLCDWAWWFKRSPEGWRWLTAGAPGAPHDATAPAGWVCESASGEVRGFLGNFLQRFDYRGETFLAVDAMNDPRGYMVGKRLLEAGKSPDPAAVADPATELKTLL